MGFEICFVHRAPDGKNLCKNNETNIPNSSAEGEVAPPQPSLLTCCAFYTPAHFILTVHTYSLALADCVTASSCSAQVLAYGQEYRIWAADTDLKWYLL